MPPPEDANEPSPRPAGYVDDSVLTDPRAARSTLESLRETELEALVTAISRASAVMNVANFLQFQPLVELCGLSLAMIIRGRTLEESKGLFASADRYIATRA